MLRLLNSFGKELQPFAAKPKKVTVFTCGPSVYQRSHIGNFRTFVFEDILVRYLAYKGYSVVRGMNFTDIEDKAISEALRKSITVTELTRENISRFLSESEVLRLKKPDYLPIASEHVTEMAKLIEKLLSSGHAYWFNGNVYFDPLTCKGFGRLFGLDMSQWPKKKRRFHQDTYPGIQWNRGDFILWHGHKPGDKVSWKTSIGRGRPSWNIQDPALVLHYFNETLSIYCGGIDNLYRHHDYSAAILESVRPYEMARFWLHGEHLTAAGRKMSKSKGNIVFVEDLLNAGYSAAEIRFFLIYSQYRKRLSYSEKTIAKSSTLIREIRSLVKKLRTKAGSAPADNSTEAKTLRLTFGQHMDNDLDVRSAVDGLYAIISGIGHGDISKEKAAGITAALKEIDTVLQVLF